MYISEDDLLTYISPNILEELKAQTTANVAQAITLAQAQAESYLRTRYDMAAVWAAAGNDRNMDLVEKLCHLTLYKLHKPIAWDAMPKHYLDDYNAAITWFEQVSKLNLNPDLPLLEDTSAAPLLYGSNPRRINHF